MEILSPTHFPSLRFLELKIHADGVHDMQDILALESNIPTIREAWFNPLKNLFTAHQTHYKPFKFQVFLPITYLDRFLSSAIQAHDASEHSTTPLHLHLHNLERRFHREELDLIPYWMMKLWHVERQFGRWVEEYGFEVRACRDVDERCSPLLRRTFGELLLEGG